MIVNESDAWGAAWLVEQIQQRSIQKQRSKNHSAGRVRL